MAGHAEEVVAAAAGHNIPIMRKKELIGSRSTV